MDLPPYPMVVERRVEFSQTDTAGLIHFSTYFLFMESAEGELLRRLGKSIIWKDGNMMMGFPRVECQCSFRSPARYDDVLRIEIRATEITEKSIHYHFSFFAGENRLCAEGTMVTVCVRGEIGKRMGAILIPDSLRSALTEWKNQGN